ncbi:IS3 family transposase, partial [Escherichia coli]|nr:IS3 family transposase [Escherichia coli]
MIVLKLVFRLVIGEQMIDVLGPKKRRRRTTQEKIAIVQQSFEPGMTVSLVARGWGISLVSRCLRVSRAQLHVILRRTDDWKDGRRSRHTDDTDVLLRIHHVIGELPTYGYRRVWALLRRQAELDGMPAINAKRVYRIMRQNALLLERKPAVPPSKRAHTGRVAVKESNQR